MNSKIEQVTRWKTTDGEEFSSESNAIYWQHQIDTAEEATRLLNEGKSVADCLRAIGCQAMVTDEIFEAITKDSKLVISHWQCRETPSYMPIRFTPKMEVFCHGDAGSWSGAYGGNVDLKSLVRYAKKPASAL
jgi:hypothetical protein